MNHVSPYYRYLAIPKGYGPTDGLRWARNGDAIETADGKTFIFTAAMPPFLEGFAAQRPLIHFAHILDLLDLLGHRNEPWDGIPRRACTAIRDAFRSEGTLLRNAGAFLATICKDVPSAHLPGYNDLELAKWLAASPSLLHVSGWENPEQPPLDCSAFHRLVSEALQRTGEEAIRHWFRFGRAPLHDEGKRLAEEVVDAKPPAYHGTLDDLIRQRPRLAGALPLLGTMVSALTMPPRRRTPPVLPLGGYADVTNRGEPERLLPSQFALDADEFVRRFAEKELLFFRKEEPHQRTREQLVLLVDQGVRTWGAVRLALSAAVLAFRKLAERKKLPFRIRFGCDLFPSPPAGEGLGVRGRNTSSPLPRGRGVRGERKRVNPSPQPSPARGEGEIQVPLSPRGRGVRGERGRTSTPHPGPIPQGEREKHSPSPGDLHALADRLEASDLSLNPAELVAAEINDADQQDADIVLLTHPRNLRNEEVQAAGANLPENKRLFALTVDEDGAAQFGQLRHGEEVTISRFRVDFRSTEIPPDPLPTDTSQWTGDVEPVPFAFPVGPFRKITALGFDADSQHLLVATDRGFLFLYSIDGGKLEMLPRGRQGDELLFVVESVLGMHGGFAVGGRMQDHQVVVYYDLRTRTAKLMRLGPRLGPSSPALWYGYPQLTAVAVRQSTVCHAINLRTGEVHSEHGRLETANNHATLAYVAALNENTPPPHCLVVPAHFTVDLWDISHHTLSHDKENGKLGILRDKKAIWLCPIADGRKSLQGVDIKGAQAAGRTLAIRCEGQTSGGKGWVLLDAEDPANIKEISDGVDGDGISRVSPDGHYFAHLQRANQLAVHAFPESGKPVFTTRPDSSKKRRARYHNNLSVSLGEAAMEIVIGRIRHTLSWQEGPLRHTADRIDQDRPRQIEFTQARRDPNHCLMQLDSLRFMAVVLRGVNVLVDVTGQVIVRDICRDRVVCIFSPRREQLAAWMPDGTRYGPSDMIGGPATPDALERLGIALRQASLFPVEA